MRIYISMLLGFCLINLAVAKEMGCESQAEAKKLSGVAKENYVKRCQLTSAAQSGSCDGQANTKKLAGAAKIEFLHNCYRNTGMPVPTEISCEFNANSKKLVGAQRAAFLAKCRKGSKTAPQARAK